MRIYLDESKKIDKWKIVIGWFFTYHNTNYIETFIWRKKEDFNIPKGAELKSTKKYWKYFIEKISLDEDYKKLDIYTFGFKFDNYFIESPEWYINLVLEVLIILLNHTNPWKWSKINFFHDNINAKDNNRIERNLDKILNNRFWIKSSFKIHNSKKYLWLQLADLIVSKYKEIYLFEDITSLDYFISDKDFEHKKT